MHISSKRKLLRYAWTYIAVLKTMTLHYFCKTGLHATFLRHFYSPRASSRKHDDMVWLQCIKTKATHFVDDWLGWKCSTRKRKKVNCETATEWQSKIVNGVHFWHSDRVLSATNVQIRHQIMLVRRHSMSVSVESEATAWAVSSV